MAYSVDATKKATKVYLDSTNLWYLASKGTKTTVLTRPATDTAPASYCIATTKAAAFHPTWVSIYDSLQPGIHEGPALTC